MQERFSLSVQIFLNLMMGLSGHERKVFDTPDLRSKHHSSAQPSSHVLRTLTWVGTANSHTVYLIMKCSKPHVMHWILGWKWKWERFCGCRKAGDALAVGHRNGLLPGSRGGHPSPASRGRVWPHVTGLNDSEFKVRFPRTRSTFSLP